MPIPLTYPGVYIEEVPSGVRTITGVPTSIAAFVGAAPFGLVNEPTTVFNFSEFSQSFGGLDVDYPLTYAVRDFFTNGGGQAVIVRTTSTGAAPSTFTLTPTTGDPLILTATSPGTWGSKLYVQVDTVGLTSGTEPASQFPPLTSNTQLFNLKLGRKVQDGKVADIVEEFRNLTAVVDCARRIDRVLAVESAYLTVADPATQLGTGTPSTLPTAPVAGSPGNDGTGDQIYFPAPEVPPSPSPAKVGILALDKVDIFNLLCLPSADGDLPATILSNALQYCVKRRAMLLVDPPSAWDGPANVQKNPIAEISGVQARNAAVFFPSLNEANPLKANLVEKFVPCGAMAGIFAATDSARGVWKAPAGVDAGITGIDSLSVKLSDDDNGLLNPLGVNCLRTFPVIGTVVWGSRTLRGADQLADEYKYIPVRRTALFIEESLYRGTKWVVFEPNDERLWSQVRLNVGAFMHDLFRQGAFQGQSAKEAYFVKCDKETTLQNDIDRGILNILVGFAPLKPAEFVVIKLQQMAGQIAV
jgi:uncharacterized protein